MRRALVRISSVVRLRMSSGMSSHVSSGGTSGVTSMAAAASAGAEASWAADSGCFSGLGGGVLGGGAEDIEEAVHEMVDAYRTRVPGDDLLDQISATCPLIPPPNHDPEMKLKGVKKVTPADRSRPPFPSISPMAEQGPLPAADDRSRYETLKKELMQALPKKRAIDKQLVRAVHVGSPGLRLIPIAQAQIEVQIYNLEASYLTETAAHSGGNIIQGFENYLKNQSSGRRRYEVHDHDRIFSNSSLTYQKVISPLLFLCLLLMNSLSRSHSN